MTRFNMFTEDELDSMEDAFLHCEICPYANEVLKNLIDEICRERSYRENTKSEDKV